MRKYNIHISRRMSTELKICILLFIISVRWKLFFGVLKKKWNVCFYYSGGGEGGSYRTLNRFVYMYNANGTWMYTPAMGRGIYSYWLSQMSAVCLVAQWIERLPIFLVVGGSNPSHLFTWTLFCCFKILARSNAPSASVFERLIFNTGL